MLSRRDERRLVRCLEQQLWFWGQDVLAPVGNLLVARGFTKWKPRFVPGSSRYRLAWRDRVIELHSFCAGIYGGGREGFVYVRAHDAAYGYRGERPPMPDRYRQERLTPVTERAVADFAAWVLEYESWVDAVCGTDYRPAVYRRYHRRWRPPQQARQWLAALREWK